MDLLQQQTGDAIELELSKNSRILYDEKLQIEKDTLRSGAVTASEKLPSAATQAAEALEKDLGRIRPKIS